MAWSGLMRYRGSQYFSDTSRFVWFNVVVFLISAAIALSGILLAGNLVMKNGGSPSQIIAGSEYWKSLGARVVMLLTFVAAGLGCNFASKRYAEYKVSAGSTYFTDPVKCEHYAKVTRWVSVAIVLAGIIFFMLTRRY